MKHQPATANPAFEIAAPPVLSRLRETLAGVLEALPGGLVHRPADLQRALEIGTTPAWQIFRVATAPDPLVAASLVPGPGPMKRFLGAAARRGVPPEALKAASEAYQAFRHLVTTHAGDRGSFDSLIAVSSGSAVDPVVLQHKRAAFRAASHFWGAQAKATLHAAIVQQGSEAPESTCDVLNLSGHVGLRRFHPETPLILNTFKIDQDDYNPEHVVPRAYRAEPLAAPDELVEGVPLLKDFCSAPLPPLRQHIGTSGEAWTEMMAAGVGNESAVTYFLAYIHRNFPAPEQETEPRIQNQSWIRIPTEVIIRDVLFPRGRYRPTRWKAEVFADRTRTTLATPSRLAEMDRLFVQESVVHVGSGLAALRIPEVPGYAKMARLVCERAGWDPESFDVYRCRAEYPIVGAVLLLSFELEE